MNRFKHSLNRALEEIEVVPAKLKQNHLIPFDISEWESCSLKSARSEITCKHQASLDKAFLKLIVHI